MSVNAFAMRQRAAEGHWFNTEDRLAIVRRLERMVESGKLDKSALDAINRFESPTEIIKTKENPVFEYKKGLVPPRRVLQNFSLGTSFSLGRGRWTAEDVSIFSVADGKRMASTPAAPINNYDNIRMIKIQKAALETPTVAGYRVLPELTPGRAMLWGTVLAIWATGALVATTMKSLEIQGAADAPEKLKLIFAPFVAGVHETLAPWRSTLSTASAAGNEAREETAQSVIVQRLKNTLMA